MIYSSICIVLLEIIVFISNAVKTEDLKQPAVLNVKLNRTVYIRCSIYSRENTDKLVYWDYSKSENSFQSQLICLKEPKKFECVHSKTDWNKKNEPQIKRHQIEIELTTEFIKISRVQKRHNGQYTCKVQENTAKTKLNVLSAPEQPILSVDNIPGQLTENHPVILKCKTKGANPRPKIWFKWQKIGYDDSMEGSATFNSSKLKVNQSRAKWVAFGETDINMTWIPKHNFNGYTLYCVAMNSEDAVISRGIMLDIAYRPVIRDFPRQPYYAMTKSEIFIDCTANSHERHMNFWWIAPNRKVVSRNSTLILRNIQLSDDGMYTCSVNNSIGTSSQKLQLQVLTAPIIEIPEHKSVVLNQDLELICYSMPLAYNTSWIDIDTNKVIANHRKVTIQINDIRPIRLKCRIFMKLPRTNQNPLIVPYEKRISFNVTYKPGSPTLTARPANTHLLGKSLTLSCVPNQSRPGYPKAGYLWHRKNDKNWYRNRTNFISFSSLKYEDADEYICTTVNSVGRSEQPAFFELVIEGKPQLHDSPPINQPIKKYVKLNSQYAIQCQFIGFPKPNIKWYKEDQLIANQGPHAQFSIEDQSLSQTVIHSIFSCGKNKPDQMCRTDEKQLSYMIVCIANNSYGVEKVRTNVRIQYPPELLSVHTIVSCDKFGQNSDQAPVRLNCTIKGSQLGWDIRWVRQVSVSDNEISIAAYNRSRYKFYTETSILGLNMGDNAVWGNIMEITEFEESRDYGRYLCIAKNKYGEIRSLFEIRKFSIPDQSHDLKVEKVFWNSIRLSWIPGYHGGYRQQFRVNYTSNHKLENKVATTYQSSIMITNLLPNTNYAIKVSSHNDLGESLHVMKVRVKTRDSVSKSTKLFSRLPNSPDVLVLNFPASFNSPSLYCLQVQKSLTKYQWEPLGPCVAPDSDSRVALPSTNMFYRARICYLNRMELCSNPLDVPNIGTSKDTTITAQIIGTVAAVCVALVVLLAIFLFLILLRSKRSTLQFDFGQLTRKVDKKKKSKHEKLSNRPSHILKLSSSSSKFNSGNSNTNTLTPTYCHDNTTTQLTTPPSTTNILAPPPGYCSLLNTNTYACMTQGNDSALLHTLSNESQNASQFECINFCVNNGGASGHSTLPHHFKNHHQQQHNQQQQQQHHQDYFLDNNGLYSTLLKSNTISPLAINISSIPTVSRSMPNEIADWCCHDNNIIAPPVGLPTFPENPLPIFNYTSSQDANHAHPSQTQTPVTDDPRSALLSSKVPPSADAPNSTYNSVHSFLTASKLSSSSSNNHNHNTTTTHSSNTDRVFYEAMV